MIFDLNCNTFTGPEGLLKQSSNLGVRHDGYIAGDTGDAVEAHEWKCVRTINGIS